jgi:signal transduction histidine kinase
MASIVAEVEQRLADLIDEYQAEVLVPASWPVALGHAAWVEEIWVNYMSNALQYGDRPPRVELGADKAIVEGRIRFWIRDNGPGLTPEDQARLFKPFPQLSRARLGHGLGLAIVRRIVEKLGGQVGVESDGVPGHGCLFSFSLPGVAS